MKKFLIPWVMIVSILAPSVGWSADGNTLNLTTRWLGITALIIFALAYLLVMAEEFTKLRKSKPVILAAGLIWCLVEYPELMLFLLVTLTACVVGSCLSIGSAAGVTLMGQTRMIYSFFGHLKWTPVIALGYCFSILVHLWINKSLF